MKKSFFLLTLFAAGFFATARAEMYDMIDPDTAYYGDDFFLQNEGLKHWGETSGYEDFGRTDFGGNTTTIDAEHHDLDFDYIVDGKVYVTAEDSKEMVFNDSFIDSDFVVHIQGQDADTPSGLVESSLDGMGANGGFVIAYHKDSTHNSTISMEGIKHFENFYRSQSYAAGGAIAMLNGGSIDFVSLGQLVTFSNNKIVSTLGHADGGAIFMTGGATISSMRADFVGNSVTVNPNSGVTSYARGGALFIGHYDVSLPSLGGVNPVETSIGAMYSNFTNNTAAFGGAIYVGQYGKIGSLHGTFTNNTAEGALQGNSTTGGANGGAIRAWRGEIGTIMANFYGNVAHSTKGSAGGGAIALDGTKVTGAIRSNTYTGNIAFSDDAKAHGGAYSLKNQSGDAHLLFVDTNFTENAAGTGTLTNGDALGGAFYIENSNDVVFRAENKNVEMSNNYLVYNGTWDAENRKITEGEGSVREYNAIYAIDSTITLETANNSTITINDSIAGSGNSTVVVDAHGNQRYDVMINDDIALPELTIENGGVKLGEFQHDDGSYSHGGFTTNVLTGQKANVTIKENGILNTKAQYLTNVGTITLSGELELTADPGQSSGTLDASVNAATKANLGKLTIMADTTIAAGNDVYVHEMAVDHRLTVKEDAVASISRLTYHATSMAEINSGEQLVVSSSATLDFDAIELYVDYFKAGDYYNLIVRDGEEGLVSFDEDFTVDVYSNGGLYKLAVDEYEILRLEDGGLQVRILEDWVHIPEPSTATLSLLALAGLLARRRRK